MITSLEEYRYYLEQDRIALGRSKFTLVSYFLDEIWMYQRRLRYVEYLQNCKHGLFWNIIRKIVYIRLHKSGIRLGFSIPVNTCGAGLSLAHYGPIIINTGAKIGRNCRIHVGVNIGVGKDGVPEIGDNCYLGPGAKIFGGIRLGDNTSVGANAVVNRSFPVGQCVLAGVPAKIVRNKKSEAD